MRSEVGRGGGGHGGGGGGGGHRGGGGGGHRPGGGAEAVDATEDITGGTAMAFMAADSTAPSLTTVAS